jgi:hypothetical protein
MSLLDSIFTNVGMPIFHRIFGDAAIYTHGTAAPIATWAIINRSAENVGQFGERLENRITAQLPASGISSPQPGDTLTVGAVTYRIDQMLDNDGLFVTVALR